MIVFRGGIKMGDGQEVPKDFPKKVDIVCTWHEHDVPNEAPHTTIISVICHGCGAMIEDVILGEDGWLFCPCGTGIMKVTI